MGENSVGRRRGKKGEEAGIREGLEGALSAGNHGGYAEEFAVEICVGYA